MRRKSYRKNARLSSPLARLAVTVVLKAAPTGDVTSRYAIGNSADSVSIKTSLIVLH
jgi:hypothetical protein